MANGITTKPPSLLPREHGAYAQLSIALVAALALVPLSGRAWGQALASALVFLASEPALVLLGRRGEAAKTQALRPARRRLLLCGGLLLLALLAWSGTTFLQKFSVLPSLTAGAALLGLFLARREHSTAGELLGATAFSFAALPVVILGGLAPAKALTLALGLTALNGLGTILVRGFLASLKRGNARWPRTFAVGAGLGLSVGALASPLPWLLGLAPLPLLAASAWVMVAPPSPRSLRTVGWILTAGSALGALALVITLH